MKRAYDVKLKDMFVQGHWFNNKREAKYYISLGLDRYSQYLHKDGTIHDLCGAENFWGTKEEAQEFLDICRGELHFIDEKEMVID